MIINDDESMQGDKARNECMHSSLAHGWMNMLLLLLLAHTHLHVLLSCEILDRRLASPSQHQLLQVLHLRNQKQQQLDIVYHCHVYHLHLLSAAEASMQVREYRHQSAASSQAALKAYRADEGHATRHEKTSHTSPGHPISRAQLQFPHAHPRDAQAAWRHAHESGCHEEGYGRNHSRQ